MLLSARCVLLMWKPYIARTLTRAMCAQTVLEKGGLHVIGTNLHDSRRIDDQLRGRAGRQARTITSGARLVLCSVASDPG